MIWDIISINPIVKRANIKPGWLVSVENGTSSTCTFIADPNHTWTAAVVVPPVPNILPTISLSILNPVTVSPGSCSLQAVATDSDGTVKQVKFFNGTTLLGTVTSAPFTLALTGLVAGDFLFSATVEDNTGAIVGSASLPFKVAAPAPAPLPVTGKLGTNLCPLADWQTDIPLANVANLFREPLSTDGTNWEDTRVLAKDANGYVTSLLSGQMARWLLFMDHQVGDHETGEYLFTWDGEGTFSVEFGATNVVNSSGRMTMTLANGGFCLMQRTINSANYPKNFRLVKTANTNSIVNDKWLANMTPYSTLRFMDWQGINNSLQSNVPPASGQISNDNGCSPSLIAKVCNASNKHAWICMPHLATTDYLKAFCDQLSELRQDLKIYIEYSNEVWNSVFEQSKYVQQQGTSQNLSTDRYLAAMLFHAKKTVEVGNYFKTRFPNRVTTVLGAFSAVPYYTGEMLNMPGIANSIDAVAIAPYFGGNMGGATDLNVLMDTSLPGDMTRITNDIRGHKTIIDKFPHISLIAYEGGQHLVPTGTNASVLSAANKDPRMEAIYNNYLGIWNRETGGKLFMHYAHVSKWNNYGFWGAMENQTQTTYPKFKALKTYSGT